MLEIRLVGAQIGAEICGIDVKTMDEATFGAIYRAWLDYNVVAVRGQDLGIEDYLAYREPDGAGTLFAGGSERVTEAPDLSQVDGELRELPRLWSPNSRTTSYGFQTHGNLFSKGGESIATLKQR